MIAWLLLKVASLFDSVCELVCGCTSLQRVWARQNATPVSVWSQGKWLMRIRRLRASLTEGKRQRRRTLAIPEMEPAGGERERSVRGISNDALSTPWRQEKKVKWRLCKVMLDGQTLRNITVIGILVKGSLVTKPSEGVLWDVLWQKGHLCLKTVFSESDCQFLDMLENEFLLFVMWKQHNSWFATAVLD